MQQPSLRDFIEWDVHTWGRALPIWANVLKNKKKLKCLEIGSNHGGLSLWLSTRPEVEAVWCTDIENPKNLAFPLHSKYPQFNENIRYAQLNILHSDFKEEFDVVIFKSVLGACGRGGKQENKTLAIQKIHNALRPGGFMLFAENLTGHPLHRWARKKFVSWSADWSYTTLQEWENWLNLFSNHELHAFGFLSVFGRNEAQRKLLSVIDLYVNKLIPARHKFLAYGFGQK